jgi:hypothetical protein
VRQVSNRVEKDLAPERWKVTRTWYPAPPWGTDNMTMVQRKDAMGLFAINSAVWLFVAHQFILSAVG